MGIVVYEFDLVTFGAPPPPEELVFILVCDYGLQAVSSPICEHGVCRIEAKIQPFVTVCIDSVME